MTWTYYRGHVDHNTVTAYSKLLKSSFKINVSNVASIFSVMTFVSDDSNPNESMQQKMDIATGYS